jgi:anaerobic magnesium-protoporphyrin IX monomethyl ester cyclase
LRIGIETFDDTASKQAGKRTIHEKVMQTLQMFKDNGIWGHGTSVLGLPGATYESDMSTLEELRRLFHEGYLDVVQCSVATPNPGTPFYWQAKMAGWLLTEDFRVYDWHNVVVNYPDYPAQKIVEAAQEWYRYRMDRTPQRRLEALR